MRYAFYISGSSGRLKKFCLKMDEIRASSVSYVISDKAIERSLQTILEQKGILYDVFEYSNLNGTNMEKNLVLSNYMLKRFEELNIDYMISFGSHLLSGTLLAKYEKRLINFHPSILPMYPGHNAIDQAAEHGNTFLVGNTAHFIDKGMDTGMIIMQSVVPMNVFLSDHDYDSILDIQIEMLDKLLWVIDNKLLCVENGRAIIKGAKYSTYKIFPEI